MTGHKRRGRPPKQPTSANPENVPWDEPLLDLDDTRDLDELIRQANFNKQEENYDG